MKQTYFLYVFSLFAFMLEIIEHKNLEFLSAVPLVLSFDPKRTASFTISYFVLPTIIFSIYAFLALLSLNIFGSGISDEGINILKRITTIAFMFSLLYPLANLLFVNCGIFGAILSVVYSILFIILHIQTLGVETE